MSGGFWGWVAGPGGTLALTIAALALGVVLGELDGVPRGRRRERLEARGQRVARQFRRMRPPELHHEDPAARPTERTFAAIEYRPAPIWGLGTPIWAPRPRTDEEWARERHEDEAMAVANGEDAVFLAGINERLDRWLADTFGGPQ